MCHVCPRAWGARVPLRGPRSDPLRLAPGAIHGEGAGVCRRAGDGGGGILVNKGRWQISALSGTGREGALCQKRSMLIQR